MVLVFKKIVVQLKREYFLSWFTLALLSCLVALRKGSCLAKFDLYFIARSLQITGSYYYSC